MFSIIVFILILSVLVLIHELGHFIMAKRAGIGVEEFGFGLPPRAWGKKIGGTIYSLNWLPFGGFVRLVGEDPTDKKANEKNSFYVKSITQRTFVVVAGVVANFLLAFIIFYVVIFALGFKVSLPLLIDHKFKFVNETRQVLVEDVSSGSAAFEAGIKQGDSVLEIDGRRISSTSDLKSIVGVSEGKRLTFVLENPINNQKRSVQVTPRYSEELQAPAIGVLMGELAVLNYETFSQKLFAGAIHSYNVLDYSLRVFGQLIAYSISHRDITPVSEGVSGPVGIAQVTSQAVQFGLVSVLQLMGLLSLNLAFINILPLPALDGGRLFFIVLEMITRRKVYPNVEKWVHTIGFAILLALTLLITYNDIAKLIG